MFNPNLSIELRVLGPDGKPYIELENAYTDLFREYDIDFGVPRLFSAPKKTSVAVAIGVGVITGAGIYLVQKLIDDIFLIKESQPNTEIHINVQNGDNYIFIDGNKEEIIQKLKEFHINEVE